MVQEEYMNRVNALGVDGLGTQSISQPSGFSDVPRINDGHNLTHQQSPLDVHQLLRHASSNVSLPSVGSSTVQVQHIQSPSEMFSAIGVIAFFQATLSVALLSLFNDVFSDYRNNETIADASFDEVVSRVFALSLGSVLLSVYTGVASSILVAIDCSRAGAPEVIVPLVFGGVTEIAATQTFLFWWVSPEFNTMASGGTREVKVFLILISVFLLVWFFYFRISNFCQSRKK